MVNELHFSGFKVQGIDHDGNRCDLETAPCIRIVSEWPDQEPMTFDYPHPIMSEEVSQLTEIMTAVFRQGVRSLQASIRRLIGIAD